MADPMANGANTPLRLHAKLLFYGLDEGTWSDPPKAGLQPVGDAACHGMPDHVAACYATEGSVAVHEAAETFVWQHFTPMGPVWDSPSHMFSQADWQATSSGDGHARSNMKASEPSTDEGSEPKGSESDSLPESNDGYGIATMPCMRPMELASGQPQLTLVPYMPGSQVPSHSMPSDAAAMYAPYMSHDGFMASHGFAAGGEAGTPYSFSSVATGFQQNVGGPLAAGAHPVPAGGVPSIGSYAHLSGQCSRCCFHPKGRCANGYTCQFCHFDHDKRPRNGKKKRYRRGPDDMCEGMDE